MQQPVVPCPKRPATRGAAVVMPAASRILMHDRQMLSPIKNACIAGVFLWNGEASLDQDAAAFGALLRELRWKNKAWLATAETMAGWNGFEIRKAGSGRSPVRKRSG